MIFILKIRVFSFKIINKEVRKTLNQLKSFALNMTTAMIQKFRVLINNDIIKTYSWKFLNLNFLISEISL